MAVRSAAPCGCGRCRAGGEFILGGDTASDRLPQIASTVDGSSIDGLTASARPRRHGGHSVHLISGAGVRIEVMTSAIA